MIRVLVWNEFKHEQSKETIAAIYPKGIHGAIAEFLGTNEDMVVETATLYDENCGITAERLANTDVLLWWGHTAHDQVPDAVAEMVRDAVHGGMGAIFLHSAHHSKPFKLLMGTPCNLCWRESDDREVLWVLNPAHPITKDIDRFFVLEHEETYGEPYSIPTPDELLMIGNYSGGEVFRSACLFNRGAGKVFYFQPGHESYPTFYLAPVQSIITNAVRFVAPTYREVPRCPHVRNIDSPEGYVIVKK